VNLRFAPCFDARKVAAIAEVLPDTFDAFHEIAPWVEDWPDRIECMSDRQIVDGRSRGAGHGQYSPDEKRIWVNPYMTAFGIWLNILHENMHHAFPDATEQEINGVLVPWVYERVTGEKLDRDLARLHGVGPPVPGIGDRGYIGSAR
jgi:hypothetical protein